MSSINEVYGHWFDAEYGDMVISCIATSFRQWCTIVGGFLSGTLSTMPGQPSPW